MGDLSAFSSKINKLIEETIKVTSNNNSLNLNIALGYSSRHEIVNVLQQIVSEVLDSKIDKRDINNSLISSRMQNAHLGDPDLLIRTGGEHRISDFLLWQIAYSEIYFTDKFWPDFKSSDFLEAVSNYKNRERRYGKISEQIIK